MGTCINILILYVTSSANKLTIFPYTQYNTIHRFYGKRQMIDVFFVVDYIPILADTTDKYLFCLNYLYIHRFCVVRMNSNLQIYYMNTLFNMRIYEYI